MIYKVCEQCGRNLDDNRVELVEKVSKCEACKKVERDKAEANKPYLDLLSEYK